MTGTKYRTQVTALFFGKRSTNLTIFFVRMLGNHTRVKFATNVKLYSINYTTGRRAVRQRGYGSRLLIFKMANNKVDLGEIKIEEIVYSRFTKIPLG